MKGPEQSERESIINVLRSADQRDMARFVGKKNKGDEKGMKNERERITRTSREESVAERLEKSGRENTVHARQVE
jgi:hypothetical protein